MSKYKTVDWSALLNRLVAEGRTDAEIAELVGVTAPSIYKVRFEQRSAQTWDTAVKLLDLYYQDCVVNGDYPILPPRLGDHNPVKGCAE